MNRRSFLTTLGMGTAAAACARSQSMATSAPMRAVGPVGLQLYTVRDAMQRDVADTLARVAAIGYKEVEFAGYFGHTPAEIRAILDRNGLTSPSSHVPLDTLTGAGARQAFDEAKVVGHEWVTMPWLAPPQRPTTADGWKRLAETVSRSAEQAHAAGLRFAYHNHDFELAPVGGAMPLELLLGGTDPARVDFEMDVYWVTKAGSDPFDWFTRHPGRWRLLHLKDASPAPARDMRDVGSGTVDWRAVLARRGPAGTRHVFVERDDAPDPMASARASFAYLATLK